MLVIDSGSAGTVSCHASGFCSALVGRRPAGRCSKIASRTIASTVAAAMPIRIAPLTLRMSSTAMRKTPTTKTSVGQPLRLPPMPSSLGTEPGELGRRAKPASMTPMKAMNRPMPTEIATLSGAGIARKTALRKPVRTSTRMMRPSMTTRPMRSAKVTSRPRG